MPEALMALLQGTEPKQTKELDLFKIAPPGLKSDQQPLFKARHIAGVRQQTVSNGSVSQA
jgi:hypothetical protein